MYYIRAKGSDGEDTILRITFHHSDIQSVKEIDEEEMNEEIKEYLE